MDDNGNSIIVEDGDNQPSERENEKRSPDLVEMKETPDSVAIRTTPDLVEIRDIPGLVEIKETEDSVEIMDTPDSVEIKKEPTTPLMEEKQEFSESSSKPTNIPEKTSLTAKKVANIYSAGFKRPSTNMNIVDSKRMKYSEGFTDRDLTSILVCNVPKYYNEDKIAEFFKKSSELLRNEIFSIKLFQNIKKCSIGSVLLQLCDSSVCKKVLKVINGMHIDGKYLHATLDTGGHLEAIFNVNRSLAQKCSQYSLDSDDETDEDLLGHSNVDEGVLSNEKTIFGFTQEFLDKLGVKEPITEIVIVENIPVEVTDDKVGFAFAMAGFVEYIELEDGTATIQYSNPVEAIQAVSMFNGQTYYGNVLKVTIATEPSKRSNIPEGFTEIGPGLGKLGKPLPNAATYFLTDSEEKKRDDATRNDGESDILNRIRNTLSNVKCMKRKYGIHPKRIISFLNDILKEHLDNDTPQNRDPRILGSKSIPVIQPRNIPVQSSRKVGNVSRGGIYQGPNVEPGQINNLNWQHSNGAHGNSMGPSHGPAYGQFQPQGPAVGQFQQQGPPAGQFQPQGPPAGQFQPQGPPAGQFQPQGLPAGQFQPRGPPAGQFQPRGPSAGQFQQQGPPAGQFQPRGPPAGQFQQGPPAGQFQQQGLPAGQFQPRGPPAGQFQPNGPPVARFQPQGPAVNHPQPNTPPIVTYNDNLNMRGSPHGMGNRGPDGEGDSKDMVVFENLPGSVTTEILLEKVQKCGNVKFLQLTSTGTAFVKYYNRENAERCLSMFANSKVDGHHIHVRFF